MNMAALPSRKTEAFRYSDIGALGKLWPVAREAITVAAGQSHAETIVLDGDSATARHLAITLAASASSDVRILNAGSAFGRVVVEVRLGAGARFDLGAAQIGGVICAEGGGQTLEIVTEVAHDAPGATSRQIVRSVLANQATGTYLGKVAVARGANGTDAAQSVRAMLLDRTATANAKPELEIYADDVKCAHGCAVGELDAAALFYLASRGLPPTQARKLMLHAFIAEAFVGAPDEELLLDQALARLEAIV